MSNSEKIDRKEAIKRTAMIIGGAVFAPNVIGVLKGCTAQPGVDWEPVLFSNDQVKLVTSLVDVIIPADEYPSASEAGVPAFIESMVNEVYSKRQRIKFLDGLDAFAEQSNIELNTDFFDAADEQKFEIAYNENQSALEIDRDEDMPFFLRFKELTILGYFTSEIGASEVLRYEEIPGMYDGCMPYEQIGKTWAV